MGILVKCPFFLPRLSLKLNILHRFSKNTQISNLIKILPTVAELFHADGQTDRHDEANSRILHFCESA